MSLLNFLLTDNGFRTAELSDAINVDAQPRYGRLRELNLFPSKSVRTTAVTIERNKDVLHLLPSTPRGAPGTVGRSAKRDAIIFELSHFEHDEYVYADDVQNIRAFGSETEMMQVQELVADKLMTAQNKHDATLEYLRAGALKGQILDADGSTILDLFTEFGVSEETVAFNLAGSTDVQESCFAVTRFIEDNLLGDVMSGVHALCAPDFFSALIANAGVREAFKFYSSTQEPLRGDPRRGFTFAGITFEEYRGQFPTLNEDGTKTVRKLIPDGEARFFPLGTRDTFRTYFGPADYVEAVNLPGLEMYAKTVPDPSGKNKFVSISTQMNPLPICLRPQILVRGTAA